MHVLAYLLTPLLKSADLMGYLFAADNIGLFSLTSTPGAQEKLLLFHCNYYGYPLSCPRYNDLLVETHHYRNRIETDDIACISYLRRREKFLQQMIESPFVVIAIFSLQLYVFRFRLGICWLQLIPHLRNMHAPMLLSPHRNVGILSLLFVCVKKKIAGRFRFCWAMSTAFPLTFCWKIPLPLPLTRGTPCLECK